MKQKKGLKWMAVGDLKSREYMLLYASTGLWSDLADTTEKSGSDPSQSQTVQIPRNPKLNLNQNNSV